MKHTEHQIRAMHVHDAASVGHNLVAAAREQGLPWSMKNIPWYYRRAWHGPVKHPVLRSRPIIWDGTLALQSLRTDVVHVHTGGLSPHTRWLRCPWVLHLHGTDVRTRQYEPAWQGKLTYGAAKADAVLYSTPDLARHVANLTDSGIYFPITIRLSDAPEWTPVPHRVIFCSRWDDVKGAREQLEVARLLREFRPDIELVGLDWGERSQEARAAGVTLDSKMPAVEFREWLATASVVVGQMTSILSVSELEALAIGVPLFSSASSDFYPKLNHLGGNDPQIVARDVVRALDDPYTASAQQNGAAFIAAEHDARVGVERLIGVYGAVIEAATMDRRRI